MSGKSNDKFYKTQVYAEDMTDVMLEKVLTTARNAFQMQVAVRKRRRGSLRTVSIYLPTE